MKWNIIILLSAHSTVSVHLQISVKHKGEERKRQQTTFSGSTSVQLIVQVCFTLCHCSYLFAFSIFTYLQSFDSREHEVEAGCETASEPTTFNDGFVVNNQTLEIGMTVACFLPRFAEEQPQIGQVVDIADSEVGVEWMTGTNSEPWVVCKSRACGTW